MPQFLEETTIVRLSLVCCLKMNWWAFKTQAVFSNLLTGGNVSPKEFMMQQVLMDDSQEPVDPAGVWSRGFSLPKSHCLFQKHGVNAVLQGRQAYPHGSRHGSSRRIVFIAGVNPASDNLESGQNPAFYLRELSMEFSFEYFCRHLWHHEEKIIEPCGKTQVGRGFRVQWQAVIKTRVSVFFC